MATVEITTDNLDADGHRQRHRAARLLGRVVRPVPAVRARVRAGRRPTIPTSCSARSTPRRSPQLGAAFNIMSIPTLMIFREQVLVFSQPGALPAPALDEPDRAGPCARHGRGARRDREAAGRRTPRDAHPVIADLSRLVACRHASTPRRLLLPHRWRVLIAWVVLLVGVNVLAQTVGGDLLKTFSLPGSESQRRSTCSSRDFAAQGRHRRPRVQGARRRHRHLARGDGRRSQPVIAELAKQPHVVSVTLAVRSRERALHLERRQDRVRRDPVRRAGQRRAGRPRDAHARHREQGEQRHGSRSSSAARCSPTRRSPRARRSASSPRSSSCCSRSVRCSRWACRS